MVLHTLQGFLITYSIVVDPHARVYQQQFQHGHKRSHSVARLSASDDVGGLREVTLRFRMAIKIDAGINRALALDRELIVATTRPAAIQCIKWSPDGRGAQTSTELLSKIPWISKKSSVVEMFHDRAMSLSIWVTDDGKAFSVQRAKEESFDPESPKKLFQGHCFHDPGNPGQRTTQAAINARFSLLAVSCVNGEIWIYSVKDYAGNISVSHKLELPGSMNTIGRVTSLSYSPEGYCLFAGYENGWTTWSVFGKPGGSSFNSTRAVAEANGEGWLHGVSTGNWLSGGSELLLTAPKDSRLWNLEMARSAVTGCFSSSNLARALLQTTSEIVVYQGHDLPDLTTISGEASLWHHAQYPPTYLQSQWPIRSSVISQDGRYVAIAGRRGLAHYSLQSARWKVFEDGAAENSFTVRGGMCWYGHVLIAATESDHSYELRLYSRESSLDDASTLHVETLSSPVVFVGPSGEDSLLVYTYENVLYHYVINVLPGGVSLVQVGQIALHGIVRAPARVRSVSWVIPDSQLRNGDPSQDVSVASVLFLVDDKLVLLQPTRTDDGSLKYDMRVIAQHIEYYILMRDQLAFNFAPPADESAPPSPSVEAALNGSSAHHSLRDSLWIFGGSDLRMWNDVQDVLQNSLDNPLSGSASSLNIPIDYYPLSILLNKGVVLGVESEMIQRRDVPFAIFRFAIRTQLFIPYLLRHQLYNFDTPAAVALSHHYADLSYLPHALEMLLHNVLDDEVDRAGSRDESNQGQNEDHQNQALLPTVLMFLQSSFAPDIYLDIIVQCTRKTELRSWRTLFAHLSPPTELFEQAFSRNLLKTAGGYLLVMQAFDDEEGGEQRTIGYVVRLLRLAGEKNDWELCAELARFLDALDSSGDALRQAIVDAGLERAGNGPEKRGGGGNQQSGPGPSLGLKIPQPNAHRGHRKKILAVGGSRTPSLSPISAEERRSEPRSASSGGDYFSSSPGQY